MSIQAIAWAKKQKTGSPTMKAVLVAICDYADERGMAWPSQKRIADDTELNVKSVRTAMQSLEDAGFIRREATQRDDGSRGTDKIFLCHSGGGVTVTPGREPVTPGTVRDTGGVGNLLPRGGVTVTPLTTFEPSSEPPEEPVFPDLPAAASEAPAKVSKSNVKKNTRPEYHGDFEMLWAEYPKNLGSKKEAYAAWLKLPDEDRDACFDGARAYIDWLNDEPRWSAQKRQPPPSKHLTTFINQRVFDTALEQAQQCQI